ncbi:MAG: transcriptional regulator [Peptococcaceae bacterium]|jgi:DNA-binding transcriptional regulator GbsR (MarR family)|nr:transcriptional regulator [Peptococcaceae bacterium]
MDDIAIVLTEDKYRFIEKMGLYYENYGLPRIGGRILGLVLIADRPVSGEEIARLLRVSRSSVSTNLRLLLSFVFLEKVAVPVERSDYFAVSELAWRNTIKMRIEAYRNLQGIAEQGLAACDPDASSSGRLLEMLRWVKALAESHEKLLAE